jgi:hypothetical protein
MVSPLPFGQADDRGAIALQNENTLSFWSHPPAISGQHEDPKNHEPAQRAVPASVILNGPP